MGTTIHQLRGIVTSDIKGFVLGMDTAGKSTRKLATEWNNARAAIWSASQRILAAVAAMTAVSVKHFADFEDAMVEVGAITRTLGTKDFALLEKAAIEMGEKTRYSATEAAGGLKQLSLSGLDARGAIEALEPTLNLATASGLSIAQSASISAKMMKAMGIEARDLAHVNDVLVSTFQRSNTDLNMLSEGMKHAAPLAHTLGISLEDVTAVLAKLSDAGFQGEMGGTALRNIVSRLAGAMPRMTKQFKELGIETMDAAGNMRPIIDILEDIEEKGMSAGKIMELFGQRGGPQLLALLQQGISGIRQFSDETKRQAGVAEEMQKARTQTIKGQFDELTSFIETIFLDTGKAVSGEVRKLINDIETFLRVNRREVLDQMSQAAFGLVDALRSLFKWFGQNRTAISEWASSFGGVIKAVASFMSKHPQLMAALIALKVTGFLGINQAVISLGKALVETVRFFYSLATAATAASTATVASETASAAATTVSTAATVAGTAATTASATATTAATTTVASFTAANTAAAAACTSLTTVTTWLTATVVESTFAYVTYEASLITVVSTQTAMTTAVVATNAALIVQGRTILALAVMQARLSGAVGTTTVSQGLLTGATNAATTALTVQGTAASATAASLGTVATASTAAGTSGVAAATGIRAAFAALFMGPGGIAVLAAAAVGSIALLFYKMRIDAQNQLKEIAKSFEELREKNINITATNFDKRLQKARSEDDPRARAAAVAAEADQRAKEEMMWRDAVNDPTTTQERARAFQDNVDSNLRGKQNAQAALFSQTDAEFKAKYNEALKTNANEAEKLLIAYNKLKEQVAAQTIAAGQFVNQLEVMDLEFDKIARNLPPVLEELHQFADKGGIDSITKEFEQYTSFIAELGKMKGRLGASFEGIVGQVQWLNQQLAQGMITAEEHGRQIAALREKNIKPILEADNNAMVESRIKENELSKRKQAQGDFETVAGLIGTTTGPDGESTGYDVDNLSPAAMEAIGASIEGATPEIIAQLVEDFTSLQAEGGEAVQDGMDELILSFLESVEEAKTDAEKKTENSKAALDAYRQGGSYSDIRKYENAAKTGFTSNLYGAFNANQQAVQQGSIGVDQYQDRNRSIGNVAGASAGALTEIDEIAEKLNKGAKEFGKYGMDAEKYRDAVKRLTDQFAAGTITEDQFSQKLKELKSAMEATAAAGQKTIEMEKQYAKIMALRQGNLAGAGVNLQQMIMDKVLGIQMGQIDQWVDWYVSQVLGLGNATQGLAGQFQQFGDQMDYYSTKAGDWFESKLGGASGGGSIQAGLDILFNSIQGQVANLTNTISMMAQSLQLTNLTMTRKLEIQRQIEELIRQRDALLTQPPPQFVGTSYDAFFTDPGIRNGQPQAPINSPVSMSFPNINRFTSQDASMLADALEQEWKRRGFKR